MLTGGARRSRDAEEISRNMSAIRSTENKTELQVRRLLFALGFRFRKYHRAVVGRPDIVFSRYKVAVFIDGDYWHARALREQGPSYFESLQSRNPNYWRKKFASRIVRDDHVRTQLEREGWLVLRFWESDAKRDPLLVALAVADALLDRARRAG